MNPTFENDEEFQQFFKDPFGGIIVTNKSVYRVVQNVLVRLYVSEHKRKDD